jgi:ketosteroid isomerase-like protein
MVSARDVVERYVKALQDGDLAALRASFAPDATWWLRGDLPVSGTYTGATEILDGFLAAMVARLDPAVPVTQTLNHIVADENMAVAEWTSHARSVAGEPYDNDYAVVFEVRDDRITAVREYFDTAYAGRVLFPEVTS